MRDLLRWLALNWREREIHRADMVLTASGWRSVEANLEFEHDNIILLVFSWMSEENMIVLRTCLFTHRFAKFVEHLRVQAARGRRLRRARIVVLGSESTLAIMWGTHVRLGIAKVSTFNINTWVSDLLAVLANLAEAKHVLLAEVAHAEDDAALEPADNKRTCNYTSTQLRHRRGPSNDGQTRDKHVLYKWWRRKARTRK